MMKQRAASDVTKGRSRDSHIMTCYKYKLTYYNTNLDFINTSASVISVKFTHMWGHLCHIDTFLVSMLYNGLKCFGVDSLCSIPLFTHAVESQLTDKAPPTISSRRQFQILLLYKNNIYGMIFNENRLLADDSHDISYISFVKNLERCHKNCRLLQSLLRSAMAGRLYKLQSKHTSNSGFDQAFIPCLGYILFAADRRVGYQISWVDLQREVNCP